MKKQVAVPPVLSYLVACPEKLGIITPAAAATVCSTFLCLLKTFLDWFSLQPHMLLFRGLCEGLAEHEISRG